MNIDTVLRQRYVELEKLTKDFEGLRAICVAEGDVEH